MTDETWKFQLNLKLGAHLLNIRGDTWVSFKDHLRLAKNESEEIRETVALFDAPMPQPPVQPTLAQEPRSAPTPTPAPSEPIAPPASLQAGELGPVRVDKLDVQEGVGKNGKPYTRYTVVIGGTKTATFDKLLADIARNLLGKYCYFKASKGDYGNDLESIRPA